MKKLFAFLIVITVLFAVIGTAVSQTAVEIGRQSWVTNLGDDSAGFSHSWFFDIPDGVVSETVVLGIWANSSDATVDLDLSAWQCLKVGGREDSTSYKLAADSVIVKTTHDVETYTLYPIYGVAHDTLDTSCTVTNWEGTNKSIFNKSYMVNVQGGGSDNNADTEYVIVLYALKQE